MALKGQDSVNANKTNVLDHKKVLPGKRIGHEMRLELGAHLNFKTRPILKWLPALISRRDRS